MGKKIAIIAVHGVADQQPGETAQALVDLLVSTSSDQTTYVGTGRSSLTLQVPPLVPQDAASRTSASGATPLAADRPPRKAFIQSWLSDLVRPRAGLPGRRRRASAAPPADMGLTLTKYLLDKHQRNGAGTEAYDTSVIHLQRKQDGRVTEVDMYEMYWADLSRLSGAVPRIIAEAFTLLFRLAQLGRDTVDFARQSVQVAPSVSPWRAYAWVVTCWTQRCLNWSLSNLVGVVALQLILCAGLLLLCGLARTLSPSTLDGLLLVVPAVLLALGLAVLVYKGLAPTRCLKRLAWPLGLIQAGLLVLIVREEAVRPLASLVVLLAGVSWLLHVGLRMASERFPFAHLSGMAAWAITLGLMLIGGLRVEAPLAANAFQLLAYAMQGPLFAIDAWLQAFKAVWIGVSICSVVWLLAGGAVARGADYQIKASVVTGRMGQVVSTGAFLAVLMSLWALLMRPLQYAVGAVDEDGGGILGALMYSPLTAHDASMRATLTACAFLDERFVQSTDSFVFIVGVLICFVAWVLAMLVPSILAEMKVLVESRRRAFKARSGGETEDDRYVRRLRATQLGRWLTLGYRRMDSVASVVTMLAIVFSGLFAAVYLGEPFVPELLKPVLDKSALLLGLENVVVGATGLGASLIALGGVLSRRLPVLRGPLDTALDVDNYFREFPRTEIPRARIFSRYAALLRHLRASGEYRHIVVVAHSQGTVISADLLRYFHQQRAPLPGLPVRLFTLGSPLRQLYAARFPTLYRWVLAEPSDAPGIIGPRASDIGVERWFNAFTSGDYVGRWLWSKRDPHDCPKSIHPCDDKAEGLGRQDAYQAWHPASLDLKALMQSTEAETCLGMGAHTHYFEPDQLMVAWMIDVLVVAPIRGGARAVDAA